MPPATRALTLEEYRLLRDDDLAALARDEYGYDDHEHRGTDPVAWYNGHQS